MMRWICDRCKKSTPLMPDDDGIPKIKMVLTISFPGSEVLQKESIVHNLEICEACVNRVLYPKRKTKHIAKREGEK